MWEGVSYLPSQKPLPRFYQMQCPGYLVDELGSCRWQVAPCLPALETAPARRAMGLSTATPRWLLVWLQQTVFEYVLLWAMLSLAL